MVRNGLEMGLGLLKMGKKRVWEKEGKRPMASNESNGAMGRVCVGCVGLLRLLLSRTRVIGRYSH